eukprot:scaffold1221_cov237-Pinguiococcus_pyrenoidosus.AAC.1
MKERHKLELRAFQERLLTKQTRAKFSRELLGTPLYRDASGALDAPLTREHLAKARDYTEAHKIKLKADALEAWETERWRNGKQQEMFQKVEPLLASLGLRVERRSEAAGVGGAAEARGDGARGAEEAETSGPGAPAAALPERQERAGGAAELGENPHGAHVPSGQPERPADWQHSPGRQRKACKKEERERIGAVKQVVAVPLDARTRGRRPEETYLTRTEFFSQRERALLCVRAPSNW